LTEELIKQKLKEKYGDFTLVPLTGGYTNQTYLLEGIAPLLVVKAGKSHNEDFQNEVNSLKIIKGNSVPKIYELIELKTHQLIVMEYRSGKNGQSILDDLNIARAKKLYKELGESLAKDIHSLKYNQISYGVREYNLNPLQTNLGFIPSELFSISKDILKELTCSREEWVLNHGDYGPHNVLLTEDHQLTVLDWEWSEWGNPLSDIGWVCWFTSLHYPELSDTLIPFFIEGYLAVDSIKLSAKKLKAYCIYKVWKVLVRIEHAPIEVKQEWIRRLKWTIETDIFHLSIFQ
jgi:thiamine kinase-like enzyme